MKVDEHGDSVYGGYYTQRQLRDVVAYARERGIEIMPEVDFPGHSRMATTVLPWLSCQGEPSSTLCVGSDATLQFCKNVYDEVFDIFPLPMCTWAATRSTSATGSRARGAGSA